MPNTCPSREQWSGAGQGQTGGANNQTSIARAPAKNAKQMTVDTLANVSPPSVSGGPATVKDGCFMCQKVVYPMDKLNADDKRRSSITFTSSSSGYLLIAFPLLLLAQLGNYAALNGIFYCKPHFKQLFTLKGNYSDGFKASEAAAQKIDDKQDTPKSSSPSNSPPPQQEQQQRALPSSTSTTPVLVRKASVLSLTLNTSEGIARRGCQDSMTSPRQLRRSPSMALAERMAAFTVQDEPVLIKEVVSLSEAPKGVVGDKISIYGNLNGSSEKLTAAESTAIKVIFTFKMFGFASRKLTIICEWQLKDEEIEQLHRDLEQQQNHSAASRQLSFFIHCQDVIVNDGVL
ncbi:hypothetical protein SpCBS45565_g02003 [Spizellomyces sp. 'palustris']|nr:hypothetical protein SpCBS45565_g02003 [Spizellomyces sp. 'palustris']